MLYMAIADSKILIRRKQLIDLPFLIDHFCDGLVCGQSVRNVLL